MRPPPVMSDVDGALALFHGQRHLRNPVALERVGLALAHERREGEPQQRGVADHRRLGRAQVEHDARHAQGREHLGEQHGCRRARCDGSRVSSEATAAAEARDSTFWRSPASVASRAAIASSGPESTRARKPTWIRRSRVGTAAFASK